METRVWTNGECCECLWVVCLRFNAVTANSSQDGFCGGWWLEVDSNGNHISFNLFCFDLNVSVVAKRNSQCHHSYTGQVDVWLLTTRPAVVHDFIPFKYHASGHHGNQIQAKTCTIWTRSNGNASYKQAATQFFTLTPSSLFSTMKSSESNELNGR